MSQLPLSEGALSDVADMAELLAETVQTVAKECGRPPDEVLPAILNELERQTRLIVSPPVVVSAPEAPAKTVRPPAAKSAPKPVTPQVVVKEEVVGKKPVLEAASNQENLTEENRPEIEAHVRQAFQDVRRANPSMNNRELAQVFGTNAQIIAGIYMTNAALPRSLGARDGGGIAPLFRKNFPAVYALHAEALKAFDYLNAQASQEKGAAQKVRVTVLAPATRSQVQRSATAWRQTVESIEQGGLTLSHTLDVARQAGTTTAARKPALSQSTDKKAMPSAQAPLPRPKRPTTPLEALRQEMSVFVAEIIHNNVLPDLPMGEGGAGTLLEAIRKGDPSVSLENCYQVYRTLCDACGLQPDRKRTALDMRAYMIRRTFTDVGRAEGIVLGS